MKHWKSKNHKLKIKLNISFFIGTVFLLMPFMLNATDFTEMKQHAENGDITAQFIVGYSYSLGEFRDGTIIEKNDTEALRWIKLSAEGGFSYAQFHLGGMYNQGIIVEKNDILAAKWFLEAAINGNISARANIAGFYYYGTGVEQDFYKAYAWASLASFRKNKNAMNLVQMILPNIKDRDQADSLAGEYYKSYGAGDS